MPALKVGEGFHDIVAPSHIFDGGTGNAALLGLYPGHY